MEQRSRPITTTPVITLQGSQSDQATQAEISAEGQLRSEVSLNFKSETFDLNKLASADEIFKLERVRSAGRGAMPPAAAAPGAATPPPAGAAPPRPPAAAPAAPPA